MNARLWLGSVMCVILSLALPGTASAQCVRDVFLALGGPAPGSAKPKTTMPQTAKPDTTAEVVSASEAQILALPVVQIVTATDWTPLSRFEGPLLRDVLNLRTGPPGDLRVFALNQYAVTIPMSDLDSFSPILALTRDGVRLKRSDFGPLFIVYPRDQYSELRSPMMAARMVWQVCRIDVE